MQMVVTCCESGRVLTVDFKNIFQIVGRQAQLRAECAQLKSEAAQWAENSEMCPGIPGGVVNLHVFWRGTLLNSFMLLDDLRIFQFEDVG